MRVAILRFHLALAFAALFSTACFEKDAESDAEEAEVSAYREERAQRDELRKRVSELRAEKKDLEKKLKELAGSLKKENEIRAKELELSTELEAVRRYSGELASLEQSLDASLGHWRTATRNSFKGVQLPEIVTVGGTRYADVTINEVTDETIVIGHERGESTVPILDLPVGLRKNVIHEPTVLAEKGP